MKNFKGQKLIGLALSIFVLFVGSVGLTGCEVESEGDAEELGEELDEKTEELQEEAE